METVWGLHILFCLTLHILEPTTGEAADGTVGTGLNYDDGFVYPDTNSFLGELPEKRLSKFVRIGRGLSSFIRIGRDQPELYGYDEEDMGGEPFMGGEPYDDDDGSAFESPEFQSPDKRLSSFVRIGRGNGLSEPLQDGFEKRGGAFIRLGKFPSSALLRHRGGMIHSIARQPYYRRSGRFGKSSFIRIGKRDTTDALNRMENEHPDGPLNPLDDYRRYLRIGKDLDAEGDDKESLYNTKRLSSFVRIGRRPAEGFYRDLTDSDELKDKRFSKFVRIGKP